MNQSQLNQSQVRPEHIIALKDIKFRWQKHSNLVLDINELIVARGESVFLQGASGSGKTTLLSLLGGLIIPETGQVHVLGRDLCGLSASQRDRFRADQMGFIFQMFNLIPYLSVEENVLLPMKMSASKSARLREKGQTPRQEAHRLLESLGLPEESFGRRRVTELSVGQQQRVAAARALLGSPNLLIADEPTSALDSDLRHDFLELLFQECKRVNTTLIFVSHDAGLKSLFDRTVQLASINAATQATHSKHPHSRSKEQACTS